MTQITCPHCGDTYPDFDVAHVCSRGPYAVKLKLKPKMNERIDQLWAQALDLAVPETYSTLSWTQVEKIKAVFAELIVRECMDCSTWIGKVNKNAIEPIHITHAINQRIKEHFGVEL